MKAWRSAATVAALITTCVVAGSGQQSDAGEQAMALVHGDRSGHTDSRFMLKGQSVKGLYPGATRQIKLTVANPFGFPLTLRSVEGQLTGTNRRACPANRSTMRVGGYSGRLPITIEPYGRRTLPGTIPVSMPRDATPKCSDTQFLIDLTATGKKAGR
ncbi:hypothetical protein KOI35_46815 [Actinoplanes bogorensis]|uniref:Uncharacterized protein n=1 Tax=Paractinoplanes bogorensis TaxID=1610840 RepID=A0ABS5Z5R9_9ACTN|nr:hypothetical protein [Actinoplanes bogorensis]MBU2671035.1 hypothetical protein [Actinoplanes bogorensis]